MINQNNKTDCLSCANYYLCKYHTEFKNNEHDTKSITEEKKCKHYIPEDK